jgi:hypothetical protein
MGGVTVGRAFEGKKGHAVRRGMLFKKPKAYRASLPRLSSHRHITFREL